jgi:hypothetical protein
MYRMAWTDERMDDFAKHTDQGFDSLERQMDQGFSRVDTDSRALRNEMKAGFAKIEARLDKIDNRFTEIDRRFERVDERFGAMQRLLLQSSVLVIVALIGLIATQL